VRPKIGRRHTSFVLSFTLRESPGHQGVFEVAYRLQVVAMAKTRPSCTPAQPPPIESGEAGAVTRVKLAPPDRGWCLGRYRATVFLQRGPYCPPPPMEGTSQIVCPLFATEELDTGHADFTVRRTAGV
jgi:hypothetical protein